MPSVVPGYEYDIFISYRHNDNLDGWVTDFVQSLEKELKATLKEPLSIYFDKNPHDGLLETHNVDKSLEGKLKCLIFIPVLSQTYCDLKSFAWQHEFCAFNQLAKEEKFGRDIKLVNGNVANRILPIKIHDLDNDDITVIENEIGGALRAIEFIYKEPGVNRPLKPTDSRNENQGKTDYRNQVNKIANAIKDIINSIQGTRSSYGPEARLHASTAAPKRQKISLAIAAVLLLVLISTFLYFRVDSKTDPKPVLGKSVAVLAFVDMSPTHDQEYLGDGIAEEIINVLAQTEGMKVIARSSSFQFKGKNEDPRIIGSKLDVSTVLEGSVIRVGDRIKVTAQLISTADGSNIWSKRYDQDASNIFAVYDEIATGVAKAFKTTLQTGVTSEHKTPWNEEAYKLYQQGLYFHNRALKEDRDKAREYFSRSLKLDSSHAIVWTMLSHYYFWNDSDKEWLRYINKAISLDSTLSEAILERALYYSKHLDFKKADLETKKAIQSNPTSPKALRNLGQHCVGLGYYKLAIQYTSKAVELDPLQAFSHQALGNAYLAIGDYNKAIQEYSEFSKFTDRIDLDNAFIAYSLAGDSANARKLFTHFRSEHTDADSLFFGFILAQCTGKSAAAESYLARWLKSKPTNNFSIAQAYAFKRDKALMFNFLERSAEKRESNLSYLLSNPEFIPYRNDPEFLAFKNKLNFP